MPAAGPTKGRRRALNGSIELSSPRIIRFRHRAFLSAESLRGIATNVGHCFGIDSAGGGQRIAHCGNARIIAHNVGERLRADVASASVADAISCLKSRLRFRQLSVFVVTETEGRDTVVFDFNHELRRVGRAA